VEIAMQIKTYDCKPTLTDTQVLQFCKTGFLLLENVVPDAINRQTTAYLEEHRSGEPTEILQEEWFVENVLRNPQAAGAVRSLLGKNFALPNLMSNHRAMAPYPSQGWHRDGGSKFGVELHYLQVFYNPQPNPREMGPTVLLPGSHFLFSLSNYMAHYGSIRGAQYASAPAGSILITNYAIWHRRSDATAHGVRNLLKYNYWRTEAPVRDWVIEPKFDPATANYSLAGPTYREQFRDCFDAAQMFFWLSGRSADFRLMGGQGWPIPANFEKRAYGFPSATPI
jgi:hypothetical protein